MENEPLQSMKPEGGRLLIASPFLDNTPFERSVILLLTNDNGFMGIVLNKVCHPAKTVNTLLDSLKDAPAVPVYDGGVVDKDILFCIHRNVRIKNSLCLQQGLYVNGDFTQLEKMVHGGKDLSDQIRFYLGYAGWSEGQLEEEILDGSWVVSDTDPEFLFTVSLNQMWSSALKRLGEPYSFWSQFPLSPLIN